MQQIPSSLQVLGLRYEVALLKETMPSNAAGQMLAFKALIKVDEDAAPERRRAVLMHEIVEAINFELDLNLKHRAITSLATAINQVLADNPALAALYAEDPAA